MLNRISIQGRLVADPELGQTKSGREYARFRIAVDRDYVVKDDNGKPKVDENGRKIHDTDFFRVITWGGRSKFVNDYFHKGDMIVLDGSLRSSTYTDKDGNKRSSIEIQADNIQFGGGRRQGGAPESRNDVVEPDEYVPEDNDLPF